VAQELKATLNLPKTDFPMKANLPQNEPKMLARWEQMGIYERIRQVRQGAPLYLLHDGPPYANGPVHLGTALNKVLKDFVVKSKNMAGFDAPYVPGWDCHGLPIEIKVDDALGRKKLEMDPTAVRRECRKYAEKYLNLQRSQFKRIGVLGRWERPYSTMTPEYEAVVVEALYRFIEQDAVYKGLRPVYWCIHDQTALAEAEVEYENHSSPSIWVKYRLTSDPAKIDPALAGKKVSTIIWTTTPWTLPASLAVAFHPDEEYVALEYHPTAPKAGAAGTPDTGGEFYIVAEKLAAVTAEKCGLPTSAKSGQMWGTNIVARFPGKKMEYATFAHPFLDRQVLGVVADYVHMEEGTGAVHTAPSHGADDFYTGQKYKLDQTCNVDEAGRLRHGLPEYDGKTVFEANLPIVELLKRRGVLLHLEKIEHSYPHCWRCHNPVIFRATEQWFISMEAKMSHPVTPTSAKTGQTWGTNAGTLRSRALEEIKRTRWDPAWGEDRISNMIATRPDWCISRQRVWGVPIAVLFCTGCNQFLRSAEVKRAVVELFAREGADAWYVRAPEQILPPGTKCPKCGGGEFRKEMDIIDVWFESGCSYLAVQAAEAGFPWPSDLYVEAGDQYRGWFHSSLLCSLGARNSAPYKMVATHGWALDMQGRAQSKSLGNVVDPVDIAGRLGGEIVRLWVASVDFREDVRSDEGLMQRVAENYRKIRNTFRYILSNLYDFDPGRDALPFEEMQFLDQVMLVKAAQMSERVLAWYREFTFHRIYQEVNEFCVVTLSNTFFDILKDRLYTYPAGSRARRSGQTAIWRIGEALVRLLAPLMSFTADEVWSFLPKVEGREESVHLAQFPPAEAIPGEGFSFANPRYNQVLMQQWDELFRVRDEVLKALETARNAKLIGSGLEAEVVLSVPESLSPLLEEHANDLRYLFIVSSVQLREAASGNGAGAATTIQVEIRKAPGQKCERCWNYSPQVGNDARHPTVCERCSAALQEIEAGSHGD
jgi:isoleucyl-tRNA synthetase